uniref:NADH dehydrogenase subunit 3 n=1 Tax=Mycetophylax simplex TaxID=341688 RepID=UPI003002722C
MIIYLINLFILILIPIILFLFNFTMSKKSYMNREKMSPFECGFDPISHARMPFSIQFFIISLIFLIFDIELTLLLPLIFLTKMFNPFIIMYALMFLIILMIGLYLEYSEFSIDWKI